MDSHKPFAVGRGNGQGRVAHEPIGLWRGSRKRAQTRPRFAVPRVMPSSGSLVDLGYVLPSINVSAVAFDDDGAGIRLRQLATPRFCPVVTIELASLYHGATRLGELVAQESVEGRLHVGHGVENTHWCRDLVGAGTCRVDLIDRCREAAEMTSRSGETVTDLAADSTSANQALAQARARRHASSPGHSWSWPDKSGRDGGGAAGSHPAP
jgi:hypothetical protein